MKRLPLVLLLLFLAYTAPAGRADEPELPDQASQALRKAAEFFRGQVSTEGGYLWRYSHDLKLREGEGRVTTPTVWVQPPGTPSVGMAFLEAYRLTREAYLLKAARDAAYALVSGQLRSGGWDYRIEFDPGGRKRYAYRVDAPRPRARNTTTLDDDCTQSALRFLMEIDRTLKFKDAKIHEAATFALGSLLKAQYANGAWPQRFSEFPDSAKFPVRKAGYPESWPPKHPGRDYRGYYTFNDSTIADMISTMLLASRTYDEPKYRAAALKAADFILLAQMPEPQPAWAQQYNVDMRPAWARRFEPPSVTGGESQGILRTLLMVYRETGQKKYLEPIPRALAYLRRSRRDDGRLARFYELKTNKPLYFVKDTYELTYRDDNLPTHYGFIVSDKTERIEREYKELKSLRPEQLRELQKHRPPSPPRLSSSLTARATSLIAALDDRGAWVEKGRMRQQDGDRTTRVIESDTFARNLVALARYVAASKARK